MSPSHFEQSQRHEGELALLTRLRENVACIVYEPPGQLEALIVSPRHGEHLSIKHARVVPHIGVAGDRPYKQFLHGKRVPGRQISAINAEVLDALEIDYDVPGDNLIVRGFDLASLEIGDALKIGDVVAIATGRPHRPCKLFAQRTSTAHYAAISQGRLRGTMLNALNAATIYTGDLIERVVMEDGVKSSLTG